MSIGDFSPEHSPLHGGRPGESGRATSGTSASARVSLPGAPRDRAARVVAAAACLVLAGAASVRAVKAAQLRPETSAGFERYVRAAEASRERDLDPGGAFLFVDRVPEPERRGAYERLRRGEILIERLGASAAGQPMPVTGGLVHHWTALVFVRGANLTRTLAVMQDFDRSAEIYRPDVMASKLLGRDGDRFTVFLRFYKKKFTTVVLNTEYDVLFSRLDSRRVYSRSVSTRIAEVRDPSQPNGPELPVGDDHGYLWRLYTYGLYQEKDGGVYLEYEIISLTRGIPLLLRWLLGPLVSSLPRESLYFTLDRTRSAIVGAAPAGTGIAVRGRASRSGQRPSESPPLRADPDTVSKHTYQ